MRPFGRIITPATPLTAVAECGPLARPRGAAPSAVGAADAPIDRCLVSGPINTLAANAPLVTSPRREGRWLGQFALHGPLFRRAAVARRLRWPLRPVSVLRP